MSSGRIGQESTNGQIGLGLLEVGFQGLCDQDQHCLQNISGLSQGADTKTWVSQPIPWSDKIVNGNKKLGPNKKLTLNLFGGIVHLPLYVFHLDCTGNMEVFNF